MYNAALDNVCQGIDAALRLAFGSALSTGRAFCPAKRHGRYLGRGLEDRQGDGALPEPFRYREPPCPDKLERGSAFLRDPVGT